MGDNERCIEGFDPKTCTFYNVEHEGTEHEVKICVVSGEACTYTGEEGKVETPA